MFPVAERISSLTKALLCSSSTGSSCPVMASLSFQMVPQEVSRGLFRKIK